MKENNAFLKQFATDWNVNNPFHINDLDLALEEFTLAPITELKPTDAKAFWDYLQEGAAIDPEHAELWFQALSDLIRKKVPATEHDAIFHALSDRCQDLTQPGQTHYYQRPRPSVVSIWSYL